MSNYFSKTLLAFIIAALIYVSVDSAALIKDRFALTALATYSVIGCMIAVAWYSADSDRLGKE